MYLAGASDDPAEAIGIAAVALSRIAALLPQDVGKPLGSAVRCAAAIVALVTDSEDSSLRSVLLTTGAPAGQTSKFLAGRVLGDELAALLVDEGLIPAWIEPLFDSAETLVATIASDGSGDALTSDEAVDLLHSLLTGLDEMMNDAGPVGPARDRDRIPGGGSGHQGADRGSSSSCARA